MIATLAAVVCYLVLRLLATDEPGVLAYALVGLTLGLAMLTKVTAVLLIPPMAVVLVAKLLRSQSPHRVRGAILRLGVLAAVAFAVCGWHYIRTWYHFGTPVIDNADPRI